MHILWVRLVVHRAACYWPESADYYWSGHATVTNETTRDKSSAVEVLWAPVCIKPSSLYLYTNTPLLQTKQHETSRLQWKSSEHLLVVNLLDYTSIQVIVLVSSFVCLKIEKRQQFVSYWDYVNQTEVCALTMMERISEQLLCGPPIPVDGCSITHWCLSVCYNLTCSFIIIVIIYVYV